MKERGRGEPAPETEAAPSVELEVLSVDAVVWACDAGARSRLQRWWRGTGLAGKQLEGGASADAAWKIALEKSAVLATVPEALGELLGAPGRAPNVPCVVLGHPGLAWPREALPSEVVCVSSEGAARELREKVRSLVPPRPEESPAEGVPPESGRARSVRAVVELGRELESSTGPEDCIRCLRNTLLGSLRAEQVVLWRGPTPCPIGAASTELSRARKRREVVPLFGGLALGHLLLVPLPGTATPPDAFVVLRSEAFEAADLELTQLCRVLIEGALRYHHTNLRLQETQHQLHQSERMKSVGQLAGGLAHDFNNLLMVISAAAEVTHQSLGPEHPNAGHTRLILNTSHRAAELTRRLLAFSRKGQLVTRVVDLQEVVGTVREFLQHALDRRIRLQVELGPRPLLVRADATQLQNALLNICLNARDAMPEGGQLRVGLRRCGASETVKGLPVVEAGYAELTIEDTGTGMDAETLTRVFDPFFTTKEVGKGTGLGLSVVQGSLREHGGDIQLESEPGRGTCCRLWLPLASEEQLRGESTAPGASPALRLRVFLVDDEPGVCRSTAQLLRKCGHNVQALQSSARALEHLKSHASSYDLLMLDVMMPKPTGVEIVRELLKNGIQRPTLLISGYSEQNLFEGVAGQPGVLFLQKPFRQTELQRAVARVMESLQKTPRPPARA